MRLKDATVGIVCLNEDTVTALVSPDGHNGLKRADTRPHAMLNGLVSNSLDKKLNSVDFDDCLFRKLEETTPSRRQVKQAM